MEKYKKFDSVINLTAIILICLIIFIIYSISLLMTQEIHLYGFSDIPSLQSIEKELFFSGVATFFTALGILSKYIYDFLNSNASEQKNNSFIKGSLKSILLALIIAPVVTASFLSELFAYDNFTLALSFCYQNGFFFQSVLEKRS